MNKTEILVVGRNENSLETLLKFINSNGERAITVTVTDEEAIEKLHQRDFAVVVLTNGIRGEEEKKLRRIFTIQNPDIIIMRYSDGDEVLLITEITGALDKLRKAKKPSFTLVDDALKNAGLNIIVQ